MKHVSYERREACLRVAHSLGHTIPIEYTESCQPICDDILLDLAVFFADRNSYAIADLIHSYIVDRSSNNSRLNGLYSKIRRGVLAQNDHKDLQKGFKFLLIKSWGAGFWSEIDNLLGNLMLAEITQRIPVVDWGNNCLFSDQADENAFNLFFEPINCYSKHDLIEDTYSYFPPKWNRSNLDDNDNNKMEGVNSRMAWIYYLNRTENVVISDFFVSVNDCNKWLDSETIMLTKGINSAYRSIFYRHLKIKPEILFEVDSFWNMKMKGQHILAVHVRGSDKVCEDANLPLLNLLYHKEVEAYLCRFPQAQIFLLTDTEQIANEYAEVYGDRLICAPCARTSTQQGVHFQKLSASPCQLGNEVIRDVFLAIRCHSFIGNGLSNVSCAIGFLKDWPVDSCRLLGPNVGLMSRLTYYNEHTLET
jgi:hypothetical protein